MIEMMCAILIVALLLLLAVPSVVGLMQERRLRDNFDAFDKLVRQAQNRAVTEQRTMVMIWDDNGLSLEPDSPTSEDVDQGVEVLPLTGTAIAIERPATLDENAPSEWYFWRSGICEPMIVSGECEDGTWKATYDPLTCRPVPPLETELK